MASFSLGILGSGHLASYTVAGIRNSNDNRNIILSPRNKETAAKIAADHDCTIALSNQDVVDQAEIILLAVRPHQLSELMTDIKFKREQLVISAIAGVTIGQLQQLSNLNNCHLVRTLPGVSAEVNSGAVPLYPENETAFNLLKHLGRVVVLDSESQYEIACTFGCLHGWVYFWLDEMISWTRKSGLSQLQAEQLVTQTVQGALSFSDKSDSSLSEIGNQIATPGTYTLSGLEYLRANHALEHWSDTLQLTLEKLNTGD